MRRHLFILQGPYPHAVFNVSGFSAGLRDRSKCAVGRARQGRGIRCGEESRSRGAARLAPGARHVRARPPGAGRLRPGQERRRPPGRRRAAEIRGHRNEPRPAQAAHRQDRDLYQDARCQGDRRLSRPRNHLPARADQGPDEGRRLPQSFRAAEFLFPPHRRLRHRAPLRRGARQARLPGRYSDQTALRPAASQVTKKAAPPMDRRGGFILPSLYLRRLAASCTRLKSAYFLMSMFFFTKPRSRVVSTLRCNASRFGIRFGSREVSALVNSQPNPSGGALVILEAMWATSSWFFGSRYQFTMRSMSSMKSTMAARFLSMNDLRAVNMIIWVTPSTSRCSNRTLPSSLSLGLNENGSTAGMRSTFFSSSIAGIAGSGPSSMV